LKASKCCSYITVPVTHAETYEMPNQTSASTYNESAADQQKPAQIIYKGSVW